MCIYKAGKSVLSGVILQKKWALIFLVWNPETALNNEVSVKQRLTEFKSIFQKEKHALLNHMAIISLQNNNSG